MKDLNDHFKQVVRDEIAAHARALGIDKDEVSYAIGGGGGMGLVMHEGGQADMMPRWTIVLTLKHKLIGYEPVANGLAIPGVMPPDEQIRLAVDMVLDQVHKVREQEFSGVQA